LTTLLLILIYIAFISLGLPDPLVGSSWPVMHTSLNVPVSYMGFITLITSGGTIVSSLMSDRLTHKLGTKYVTVISVFMTAAAMIGFSYSSSFWMLLLFSVPYGLGAGSIDAALNNFVALHYSSRHMSWLHCMWGVGTIFSPFVMNYALHTSSWNMGFRYVGIIQFIIGVILTLTLGVWKVKEDTVSGSQAPVGIINALKIKGVPALLLAFFAYCSAEGISMGWASTYFVHSRGVEPKQAATLASLFFIGITLGRFLSGFIMNRLGDHNMIRLGTSVLILGLIMLLLPVDLKIIPMAGFIIVGLGCAPVYPCIIHSTPDNFGAENSGAIIGIQMASAYVGSTFMPPLFGVIASRIGFWIMPVYILFFVILMITMVEVTFRITGRHKEVI
jgi:fucose permease